MTRLELAAIGLQRVLWENTGDTGDWPIRIEVDDDKLTEFADAANELFNAVREVDPSACEWPVGVRLIT